MNVVSPPRIESLESKTIRVIEHVAANKVAAAWTFQAYPFDSILFIKQQIALHYGTRAALPNHLFLAEATSTTGSFRPLEFRWPFATHLADPLSADVHGRPSAELMEGDVRKPVFPTILSGVTLETMEISVGAAGATTATVTDIHIWTLGAVLEGLVDSLTPSMVAGFLQLYFPLLETVADAEAALGNLTAAETESLEAVRLFQEQRATRLLKLEELMAQLGSAKGPQLQELRALRIVLPPQTLAEPLDILFYQMTPTRHLPLLRYFAANHRTPPLLKLAMNPAGIPLLADAKLLRALLGDAPAAEQGAMILGKAPLIHPKAPYGAAWVIRIYEDGSGEIVLGAPRRDSPLPRDVVTEAFQQLRGCLEATPWAGVAVSLDTAGARLEELTATYKFTLQQDIRKPTKSELRKRAEPFAPVLKEEAVTGGGDVHLRWKAVSNYAVERDPVMSYISDLFLKESLQSVDRIPVAAYVGAITREFGLGPAEAARTLSTWINRHAEYVLMDPEAPEKAVAKYGTGAAITLYNHHPDYLFSVAGVSGYLDLRRILTLLEIWVSHTSQELKLEGPAMAALEEDMPAPAPAPALPEEPVAQNVGDMGDMGDVGYTDDWYQTLEMYGAFDGEMSAANMEDEAPVAPLAPQPQDPSTAQPLALEKDVRYPDPIGPDEPALPSLDKHLIQRLQAHDSDLFSYKTEQSTKLFSRTCQSSSNKQPNVMSPEAYRRVRSLYGDTVHWVEAPLSKYDTQAILFTSKVLGERIKEANKQKKTLGDVLEFEKRILHLGIPLKDGTSVVTKWKEAPAGAREEIERLQKHQASKPLWIVVRAGTATANYYICAEFWCVRDDLPLIDAEFRGVVSRRGLPKAANTCPFCGGREIPKDQPPKVGETVMRRGTTTKAATGVVARYAGFGSELYHPKGFIVPCCFTDSGSLIPPAEAAPFPAPIVELPAHQQAGVPDIAATAADKENTGAVELQQTRNLMDAFGDVKIKVDFKPADFTGVDAESYRFLDKEKTKVELKAKAIVRAYILAASSFPLELGKVGLVSEAMDAFFGQDPKKYLESPKHGKIYTHPALKGHAFFRLGLGTRVRNIGNMMLQLIAYARAVVSQMVPPFEAAALTPEQIVADLFETREVQTFHAFQQANYGTLPAEFADPESPPPVAAELQEWCGRMGIPLPSQHAHAEYLYSAWRRFRNYVTDQSQRKELRHWEHLFTAAGLFTTTGVVLGVVTTDENGRVTLRCPSLGVSPRNQVVRPPIMLVYEDRRTRIVEPLVFYQGPDQLLGILDPESLAFSQLAPALRESLTAFYAEFFSPTEGCGRPQPVLHPWMDDDRPQTGVPRLGSVIANLRKQEGLRIQYILRDRTRRVVGVVAQQGDVSLMVPTVDDGAIDVAIGSLYDVEAIPMTPLAPLLQFLVGPTGTGGFARLFPDLEPMALRSQARGGQTMLVALETRSGTMIPIEPTRVDAVVPHPLMSELRGSVQIDFLPWLSTHGDGVPAEIAKNPEEQLEEAYQHVRLTLSEWMSTVEGRPYKRAIESLRTARRHLPLYELRKRMDILLMPVLARWIHVGPKGTTWDLATLRRNCLKMPRSKCEGACVWVEGQDQDQCLIHAVAADRYVDPVFVIGARIADELLRTYEPAQQVLTQSVARLRPPMGIVREKDAVMVSFEGRGDAAVYKALGLEGRIPSRYTQGLVIPEEMGAEDVGCMGTMGGIPLTWEGVTHMVWPAKGTGQPLREIAWSAIAGAAAWKDLMPVWKSSMGGRAFFEAVSDHTKITTLFTRDTCHGYELIGRIGPTRNAGAAAGIEDRMFVILTPDRLPLASAKTKQPRFRESELPSAIMAWLDAAPSKRGEDMLEIAEVEEHEDNLVQRQPYMDVEDEEKRALEEQKKVQKPPVPKKAEAACPEGEERSPKTGKCIKKCKEGEVRTEAGRCKKAELQQPQPQQPQPQPQQQQPQPQGPHMVIEEENTTAPTNITMYDYNALNKMKFADIMKLARDRKYTGHAGLRKEAMIQLILKLQQGEDPCVNLPYSKQELIQALNEQGIAVDHGWTHVRLCMEANQQTRAILERRRRSATRKNRRSN